MTTKFLAELARPNGLTLQILGCIVISVRATALTKGKPRRSFRGLEDKEIKMIAVIEILISLPEAILALILIFEKMHRNSEED